MRNALRFSVLLGIWLCSEPAHADAPATAKTSAPPGSGREAPHATNETAPSDPVAELYNKAQNRYLEGDVEAALHLMEQCYELSHRPNLLYNLAQIYRELGQCEPALKNYEQYLKESPNGERRDAAEQYVKELVKQCPPKESNTGSAPTTPLAPSQTNQVSAPAAPTVRVVPMQVTSGDRTGYWTPMRQGGWTLTAIGVAAAVGSVYFAVQAREAKLDAEQILRDAKADPTRTVWADRGGNAREDDFRHGRMLAIAFGGISAAALGAGIAALVLAPSTSVTTHGHLSLTVAPSVVGGGYIGHF